jgi:hypothetical protein
MNQLNDKGVVLLLVIIFGMILSIIGITTIQYSSSQKILAKRELNDARADYIAYSGLEYLKAWMQENCIEQNRFPENYFGNRLTNTIGILSIPGVPDTLSTADSFESGFAITIAPLAVNNDTVIVNNAARSTFGRYRLSSDGIVRPSRNSGTIRTRKTKRTEVQLLRGGRFSQVGSVFQWLNTNWAFKQSDGSVVLGNSNSVFQRYDPVSKTFSVLSWGAFVPGLTSIAQVLGGPFFPNIVMAHSDMGNTTIRKFDPATYVSTFSTPMLNGYHSISVPLPNGNILYCGGGGAANYLTSELYTYVVDGDTFTTVTPSSVMPRITGTATLLNNNSEVLFTGGIDNFGTVLNSAQRFVPINTFPNTGMFIDLPNQLTARRSRHFATLLQSGEVLIAGGSNSSGNLRSTELYNHGTMSFTAGASMTDARTAAIGGTATCIQSSGQVLFQGGAGLGKFIELFDPYQKIFYKVRALGAMTTERNRSVAVPLNDGTVLFVCGVDQSGSPMLTAELYTPCVIDYYPENTYIDGPIIHEITP